MDLGKLFRAILKPALGCTEPVAVALAVGWAHGALSGLNPESDSTKIDILPVNKIRKIDVKVNKNIFKNTFSIYIPNARGHKGIVMSAALGVFCNPFYGLEIFKEVNDSLVEKAKILIRDGKVIIEIIDVPDTDVYIDAVVELYDELRSGRCIIADSHTNVFILETGGEILYQGTRKNRQEMAKVSEFSELKEMSIEQIVSLVEKLPEDVTELIKTTIEMNVGACEAGLARPLGLGAGFHGNVDYSRIDVAHYISNVAAAGSDARMSGFPVKVMSSAGSGNQGIIATMPIVIYGKDKGIDDERIIRAVALSHLMTMYVTLYVGYLSALCGVAIKAGIGAACGLTYLMGGKTPDIKRAIKLMVATLSGVICDGAKPSCALKVSSAADMAARSAVMALKKVEVSNDNGIVEEGAEDTIRNLGKLSNSMNVVDDEIIKIMNEKVIV